MKIKAAFSAILTGALMAACPAAADDVILKDGNHIKGLVIEEYADRILLSTVDGEKTVLRRNIANVSYDDPAYSLMSMGYRLEREKKYPQALSYFEKAYELNPNLQAAKTAAIGIRSKMWASFTEGPSSEITKQQEIQDAWRADTSVAEQASRAHEKDEKLLRERMGIHLTEKDDFVIVSSSRLGSYGHSQGLWRHDRIYAVDGQSMRYINQETVNDALLNPRYASMTVQVRREVVFPRNLAQTDLNALGISLDQQYDGVVISRVKRGGPAARIGLKKGDRLISLEGETTRYTPIKEIREKFETMKGKSFKIVISRILQMARQ